MKRIATIAAALLLLAMSGADAQQLQTVHVSAAPLDSSRDNVIIVKADSPFRTAADLNGKTIAIAGIKTI
jgi:ABC-type nitrate/sulfonate/bicarbonate transport system substrate-binding protein